MEIVDLHPAEDSSGRFFVWREWLQVGFVAKSTRHYHSRCSSRTQANGPLTTENVFDYFVHSMFYDKQSSNQVLRMQTEHTGQPLVNEAEELR